MEGAQASGGAATPGSEQAASGPAGEAAPQHATCLNCGTALIGTHCHRCGQQAHVHRTLSAFFHDLLHGVFHFEGKVWRTVPLLLWKPGELTRRYAEGERARFVSPLAMFLFSIFLMFAVVGSIGGDAFRKPNAADAKKEPVPIGISPFDSVSILRQEIEAERLENRNELKDLLRARQKLLDAGKTSAVVDADIAHLRREIALEERSFPMLLQVQEAKARRSEAHKKPVDGVEIHPLGHRSPISAPSRVSNNPDLFFYELKTSAYKYSWVLIPILVPFVSLLFLGRRYRQHKLYDHAVFVAYALSFICIFIIAFTLFALTGTRGRWVMLTLSLVPLHMYRHLKDGYRLSRFGATWRTAALLVFSLFSILAFFGTLWFLGIED